MKLTTPPNLYRNMRRWTKILTVLSRYGLADWMSRLSVGTGLPDRILNLVRELIKDRDGKALVRYTQEQRIRMALTDLGPTFIKLGQLLSTRPDLVGVKLAEELRSLQRDVPADSFDVVRAIIEEELRQPLEEIFLEFDEQPMASASIGQVHRARLHTGELVVVKVQHEGIERTVREDLDVLAGLAALAERIPDFDPYRPVATVAELSRTMRRELDFGREERNLQQFVVLFEKDETVRIPEAYTEYCTSRILTMEYIDGMKLENAEALRASGLDLDEIARRGAELYLTMIFSNGYYHADPHPGNILLLPGNVIGLLDFGMVGRIEERLREDIEEMLLSIVHQDVLMLTSIIKRVGDTPPELDESALATDVAEFVGMYSTQSLDRFDLTGALNDITEIVRRHHILLPTQVAMLLKALVTLEGTTKLLSPQFSVMEVMQPFHRRMVMQRLSPRRQLRKARRLYYEMEQLVEVLPRRVMDILEQVRTGRFDVHLDHRGLGPSVNRLVLGMLASALFMGSSLMLSQNVPPLLFSEPWYFGLHRISLLGLSGCFLSFLVGLRLLRAIGKSGHLDRRE